MTEDEMDEIMNRAIKALRKIAPGFPAVVVIALPTETKNQTAVCVAGNMSQERQEFLLMAAMDGNKSPTSH